MIINTSTSDLYDQYRSTLQKIADVKYASAVLQWDQETYLPPKGADKRGQQIATLSELSHQMFTDDKLGNILNHLNSRGDLQPYQQKNISLSLEEFERQKKFSSDFVR